MKPDYIISTKVYAIHHQEGAFKLYISLHKDDFYYAGLSYYVKTGSWAAGEVLSIDMRLQQYRGTSEEIVKRAALEWMEENIKGEYTIELERTI